MTAIRRGARFVARRRVKPGTPGARKLKKKSAKWYGRVPGDPKPVPLSANKVAAQQLLAALVKSRPPRWPRDRLSCLAKLNAATDVRRQRRDLAVDEALRLLETTRASDQAFRGLTGEDRYFLYAVAFQSGRRAGEPILRVVRSGR